MQKKKILIIEDDNILRENLFESLNEEGYEVITATDGLKGASKIINQIPDLILCDINMPGLNGLELFKTIQQIKNISSIPFIFITAKTEKEDIRLGMQLGADDYITKPFDLNELHKTIKIRLEKHERIRKDYDEKFYALLDNPLLGVFIYAENKFLFVNNTFSKMLGLTVKELEDKGFDDLIVSENKEFVLNNLNKALKGLHEILHEEFEVFHKKKERNLCIEIYANLIIYKGFPALVGNAVDVSNGKNKLKFSHAHNTENLSRRELEMLKMICLGHTTADMAAAHKISVRTVDSHRARLHVKTNTKNTAELILYALRKRIFIID